VTTSLGGTSWRVDMITCESAQNPGVRPSDQLGAPLPSKLTPEAAPWANREGAQGPGGWKKILKPPNPERGGGFALIRVVSFRELNL
jgi:hypothetical protein